ncbi:MAG: phosphoribosylformimino-5-aminoimidazole carboxamide ribotide isomerase [Actinomycetota bacterium]|nr:phosphoribosylformimino-5-aminoimidazole carboxamide ribotide isomerase [Actinomycetota bacterium]
MSFTVFPSVDITDGRTARVLHGRFGSETVYSDDPVKIASGFSSAGARWLHLVDLDGARTGVRANRELLLEVVRRAPCPVQAGGGVMTADDVEELLAAGANRVILSAAALVDPDAVEDACGRFGERIGISLDARGAAAGQEAWTVGPGIPLADAVEAFGRSGASFFVYTDVDRDGSLVGPDVDALLRVTSLTELPVISAGGIGTLEDLKTVARLSDSGVAGVIVGRALYENKFDVKEAMLAAEAVAGEEEPLVER